MATDAHGRAALTLAESILHGLVARSVLTVDEAADIADSAHEIQGAIADESSGSLIDADPVQLLQDISTSLNIDMRRDTDKSEI